MYNKKRKSVMNTRKYRHFEVFKNTVVSIVSSVYAVRNRHLINS